MTKKIRKIQILRHLIQLISFILLPGLYVMAFTELKGIYQMILKGNFNFVQVFPGIVELLTVILITMVLGRFFCGWVCAFGAYNDLIHEISRNIFKINYKLDEKMDSVLKYLKYVVLGLIIVIMWTMGSTFFNSSSPWDAFAQITDFPQVISDFTIGFFLLILITIGALFIERFFCRYLCPLGALFTTFSKISIFRIKMPKDKCNKCRVCNMNCSMGIPLYKLNEIKGGECINCLKCVELCPRKNAAANILDENINPALAGSIAIAAFAGVYGFNHIGAKALINSGISSSVASISTSSRSSPKLKDGTYAGTGSGFRGGTTKISVTIKNGKIANINTISSEDTPDFYQRAESSITSEIISAQSASVDTVSGATFSSQGIISAVKDALTQAAANAAADSTGSSSSSDSNTSDSNSSDNSTSDNSTSQLHDNSTTASTGTDTSTVKKSEYKDGTYTGTGTGFRGGTTEVSITIKNGKIVSVSSVSSQDTPEFYQRAESTITDEIISSQSTSVDTVSGATFSSNGIINAVANALSKAV